MGIFGKKDKEKTDEVAQTKTVVEKKLGSVTVNDVTSVILRPRITEKAVALSDLNVYTFEIRRGATKYEVRDAIQSLYNVTPIRIHIVNKTPRHFMSRSRGRDIMVHGLRKAYVYLKKGDRIELV